MAKVRILGKSVVPEKDILRAADFFCGELLGKRLSKNIVINLNLIKNLKSKYGKLLGECEPIDTTARTFRICLNSGLSRRKTFLTLAHEIVHLKQFARGELSNRRYPVMKFRGVIYTERINNDAFPYEVEATSQEEPLYRLWLDYKKILCHDEYFLKERILNVL